MHLWNLRMGKTWKNPLRNPEGNWKAKTTKMPKTKGATRDDNDQDYQYKRFGAVIQGRLVTNRHPGGARAANRSDRKISEKKRVTILAVLNNLFKIIHSKFAFFKSKEWFFVKILMKFCRNFTNMLRMSRIFNFLKKRIQFFDFDFEKSVKISEMFKLFRKLFKIIQSCP